MKMFSILNLIAVLFISAQAYANIIPVGQIVYPTVVIANGGTASAIISTSGMQLVGCQIPAAFTGTAISFTVATAVDGTYQELDNASGKVTYTVAQGKYISIASADFAGVQFFKIISNASEGAARSLVCSMKGI